MTTTTKLDMLTERITRVCVSNSRWVDTPPADLREANVDPRADPITITADAKLGPFRYLYLLDGDLLLFWFDSATIVEAGASVSLDLKNFSFEP